jgi:hypothetical protein
MQLKLTKIFQKVPEGYIGFVEELPGANTQGETLEEPRSNLEEAIEGSSLPFMLNQQTRCQDNILLTQKFRKFLKP